MPIAIMASYCTLAGGIVLTMSSLAYRAFSRMAAAPVPHDATTPQKPNAEVWQHPSGAAGTSSGSDCGCGSALSHRCVRGHHTAPAGTHLKNCVLHTIPSRCCVTTRISFEPRACDKLVSKLASRLGAAEIRLHSPHRSLGHRRSQKPVPQAAVDLRLWRDAKRRSFPGLWIGNRDWFGFFQVPPIRSSVLAQLSTAVEPETPSPIVKPAFPEQAIECALGDAEDLARLSPIDEHGIAVVSVFCGGHDCCRLARLPFCSALAEFLHIRLGNPQRVPQHCARCDLAVLDEAIEIRFETPRRLAASGMVRSVVFDISTPQ